MKKILSTVIASAMLLTGSAFAKSEHDAAIEAVNRYDIMVGDTNGNFRGEDGVTRAEMARILLACANVGKCGLSDTEFSDVDTSHWASGYIKTAYDMGLIAGMGDGTFEPDSNLTYAQAVKMIVCLLGYENTATNMGGYPDGYWRVANNIGILEGLDLTKDDCAIRNNIAELICNSLDIPFMAVSKISPEGNEYTVLDGKDGKELKTIKSFFEE